MLRPSLTLRVWIVAVMVAIFAMPVSGAHLHLCFDGTEPAASMHEMQDGAHHAGDSKAQHRDRDVSVSGSAVAKKSDGFTDLPVLITAAFVLQRLPATSTQVAVPPRAATLFATRILHLLPPLRGPPV